MQARQLQQGISRVEQSIDDAARARHASAVPLEALRSCLSEPDRRSDEEEPPSRRARKAFARRRKRWRRSEADEVVCATTPRPFCGIGQWQLDFSQTSDDEVHERQARAR